MVIWSLFFLSMLGLAIKAYIRPNLDLASRLTRRAKTHYLAKAGVEKAMAEIENDNTESYDTLIDEWSNNEAAFKDVKLGDGFFSVKYLPASAPAEEGNFKYGLVDEERKINLNKSGRQVLEKFFEMAGGMTKQDAEDMASSIMDWRDEDDKAQRGGAEKGYYSTLRPAYNCKNGDFEVLEELLLIKGVTEEIFNKVKDRLTVYGDGGVNVNTADELVLQSLGLDKELAGKIMEFRNGEDGKQATLDDNAFEDTETIPATLNTYVKLSNSEVAELNKLFASGLLTVRSDNFTGKSFGQLADTRGIALVTFVFNRKSKIIKYWRQI